MNNTFNIKRFMNYEKRNFRNEWMHYGLLIIIMFAFYLFNLTEYISKEMNHYMGLMNELKIPFGLIILFSPLILENWKKRNTRLQEFLVPVTNLERFIHLAFKYFLYIPLLILLTFIILYYITEPMGYNNPTRVINGVVIAKQPLSSLLSGIFLNFMVIGAAIFLFGAYFFKKYTLALSLVFAFIVMILIIYTGAFTLKLNFGNETSSIINIYSYLNPIDAIKDTLSQIPFVLYICTAFMSYILPLGILLATYFKIREYET